MDNYISRRSFVGAAALTVIQDAERCCVLAWPMRVVHMDRRHRFQPVERLITENAWWATGTAAR